jgi:hypothetical protein
VALLVLLLVPVAVSPAGAQALQRAEAAGSMDVEVPGYPRPVERAAGSVEPN